MWLVYPDRNPLDDHSLLQSAWKALLKPDWLKAPERPI